MARGSGGAGAVKHKGNRFCVNRDPRAHQPLSPFFFLPPSHFSFYPLLPRAILSSRICDHQHAKWIKFLDYTFRSPFLYSLPIPIPERLAPRVPGPRRRPVSRRPYPRLFLRTYEYLYRARSPSSVFPPALLPFTLFAPLFFSPLPPKETSRFPLSYAPTRGRSFRIWRFYGAPMHCTSYSEYIDLPAIVSIRSLFLGIVRFSYVQSKISGNIGMSVPYPIWEHTFGRHWRYPMSAILFHFLLNRTF